MKITTQKEITETFCDITGENLDWSSSLRLSFGYGSQYDMTELNFQLKHEIAEEILELLKSKYGDKIRLKEMSLY